MTEPIVFNDKHVSIFQNEGMNKNQVSRQAFIDIDDINEIPAELFGIKISQSKKPELAGKPVFKHFRFKIGDGPTEFQAPATFTPATPVEEVKQAVVAKFGGNKDVTFQIVVNVNGQFSNIKTPEGVFTIFDEKEFPNEDPIKRGRPGYYLNNKADIDVTLTSAKGQYGQYYQVAFATKQSPDEIFVKNSTSKVWGADDSADTNSNTGDNNDGSVWG